MRTYRHSLGIECAIHHRANAWRPRTHVRSHRLVDEFEVRFLQLRLQAAGTHAQLDLVWSGQAMSTETVMSWELDPIRIGNESTPLTVRDVVDRHGGAFWLRQKVSTARQRHRHQIYGALCRRVNPSALV